MFCTEAMAATVIGNTLARKIKNIGAASDRPNHRIDSGIQAMGEMGRRIWISGLNAWAARADQPRIRPSGTPTAAAARKLQTTRNSDATAYLCSTPLEANSKPPSTTSTGVGNTRLRDQVTASCQAPRRAATTSRGRRIAPAEIDDGPPRLRVRLVCASSAGGRELSRGARCCTVVTL